MAPFLDALRERAETFTAQGWENVDLDLALFAAKAYARRNFIAHGKGVDLQKSKKKRAPFQRLLYFERTPGVPSTLQAE